MARIRIKNPAFKSFNGYFGRTLMANGESVDHVSAAEIDHLSAITVIEVIEDDGSVTSGGVADRMVKQRSMPAPVEKALQPEGEADSRNEITPEPQDVKSKSAPVDADAETEQAIEKEAEDAAPEAEPEAEPGKAHTREELEAIADEQGIRGLREIATPLGVKDNSISGLITEILRAQKA